jgi:hypothetical protein
MTDASRPKPTLWHYTCSHGHHGLGYETATLLPAASLALAHQREQLPESGHLVWLTDLDRPLREPLGLTSYLLRCDRTAYRYRVTDPTSCEPWHVVARKMPKHVRMELEQALGAMPAHWWVSFLPVPVVFNPVPQREQVSR